MKMPRTPGRQRSVNAFAAAAESAGQRCHRQSVPQIELLAEIKRRTGSGSGESDWTAPGNWATVCGCLEWMSLRVPLAV